MYGTELIRPWGHGTSWGTWVGTSASKGFSRSRREITMFFKRTAERDIAREFPFKTHEQVRAEVLAERDAIGDEVARRFSRGNVNIKSGEYLTKKDLNDRRLQRDKE